MYHVTKHKTIIHTLIHSDVLVVVVVVSAGTHAVTIHDSR